MAFGTVPIATEHQFPCHTLVACLVGTAVTLAIGENGSRIAYFWHSGGTAPNSPLAFR